MRSNETKKKLKAGEPVFVCFVRCPDATLGIMVGNARAARDWVKRGARYVAVLLDAVIGPAVREYLRVAREASVP